MQYHEFVRETANRSGLDLETACISLDAVIETLGERLTKAARDKVAAELPSHLKKVLSRDSGESTAQFDLEDFYVRVRARADTGYPQAVVRTRCILSLLKEVLSSCAMDIIFSELPPQFRELFGQRPNYPLSPATAEKICPARE